MLEGRRGELFAGIHSTAEDVHKAASAQHCSQRRTRTHDLFHVLRLRHINNTHDHNDDPLGL